MGVVSFYEGKGMINGAPQASVWATVIFRRLACLSDPNNNLSVEPGNTGLEYDIVESVISTTIGRGLSTTIFHFTFAYILVKN